MTQTEEDQVFRKLGAVEPAAARAAARAILLQLAVLRTGDPAFSYGILDHADRVVSDRSEGSTVIACACPDGMATIAIADDGAFKAEFLGGDLMETVFRADFGPGSVETVTGHAESNRDLVDLIVRIKTGHRPEHAIGPTP